ncbi:MAG: GNAT family N-acetyltransferase [Dehalococcoidia bacterium]
MDHMDHLTPWPFWPALASGTPFLGQPHLRIVPGNYAGRRPCIPADPVGTVQLALAAQQNALHRAEVQKIMVHTSARRQGIGEALMIAVDEVARIEGRTVLVLDTRHGDVSERLYLKQGYTLVGTIPNYARSASGALDDTAIYYRLF